MLQQTDICIATEKVYYTKQKQMNSHGTENKESPAENIQALRQEIKE